MFTNKTNIPLPLAIWLAAPGSYDLIPNPQTISATSLQKPLRSLVLSRRIVRETEVDLDDLLASKLGTAVHEAVENAWLRDYEKAFFNLGYPISAIEKFVVNGNQKENYPKDSIFIFLEKRTSKELDGFIISGKFDVVIDGQLHDIKTTKTYSYIADSNTEDYRLQGSIYRWLNPDLIKEDTLIINYLFTDWSPLKALADKEYPKSRCLEKHIPLYSIQETETYIKNRIAQIKKYESVDQEELPLCSLEELWQEPTKYALYADPNKTSRATKLFDDLGSAQIHNNTKCKGKGLIVKREGAVKRCIYCDARSICTQAEQLQLKGLLK